MVIAMAIRISEICIFNAKKKQYFIFECSAWPACAFFFILTSLMKQQHGTIKVLWGTSTNDAHL